MAYRIATLFVLALQACYASAAGNLCTSYSSIKTCASAKAYCSSHYPVAPVVSTATAHVSATTTITSTVKATSTAHVTSTSTITDTTVTKTATVTAGSSKLKIRNPAAQPAPCQAAYTSLTKQGASAQKTICSCIETPATSTTTTTIRTVQTAHTTITNTVTTTATAQTTTHVTATTTTTTTVQASPTGPPCSNGNYQAGSNTFNVKCGTNITTTNNIQQYGTADNIDVCISDCNSQAAQSLDSAICGVYFQRASKECTCYTRNTISTSSCSTSFGDADPDYDTAILTSGGGTGSGPTCTNGDYTAGSGSNSHTFDVGCGTNITTTDKVVADGTADNVDVCISNCNSKFSGTTNVDQAICAISFQRASGACTCYARNTIATQNCGSSFGDADADYDTAVVQSSS